MAIGFRHTVGCVIFSIILQGLKEGPFAALDRIPNFPKVTAFEDGLGKPKPYWERLSAVLLAENASKMAK
jgi:hypothetical protein